MHAINFMLMDYVVHNPVRTYLFLDERSTLGAGAHAEMTKGLSCPRRVFIGYFLLTSRRCMELIRSSARGAIPQHLLLVKSPANELRGPHR